VKVEVKLFLIMPWRHVGWDIRAVPLNLKLGTRGRRAVTFTPHHFTHEKQMSVGHAETSGKYHCMKLHSILPNALMRSFGNGTSTNFPQRGV
jgi:hypothetical protein